MYSDLSLEETYFELLCDFNYICIRIYCEYMHYVRRTLVCNKSQIIHTSMLGYLFCVEVYEYALKI